mmetsp:Transcript_22291/g.39523  ORF Transcript_22291/g.39523 Transcript_22291/m.39523 type:complete len:123 (-) Transcript_22291:52-420(-)
MPRLVLGPALRCACVRSEVIECDRGRTSPIGGRCGVLPWEQCAPLLLETDSGRLPRETDFGLDALEDVPVASSEKLPRPAGLAAIRSFMERSVMEARQLLGRLAWIPCADTSMHCNPFSSTT